MRRLLCLAAWTCPLLFVPAAAQVPQRVTRLSVEIDLRAMIAAGDFDVQRDQVGLRGDVPPLTWQRSLLAHDTDGDGLYTLTLPLSPPSALAVELNYKFKIERAGQPLEGWESGINHRLALSGGDVRLARAFGAPAPAPPLQRTGHIERHPGFASRYVAAREVQVWLPPGYSASADRRYPVLYLHDGQAMFDAQAGGSEWHVDETAERLVRSGATQPMLIVAVSTADPQLHSRGFDYTPVPGQYRGQRLGGGTPAYARFLIEELKPFVDQRYRTLPDAAHTWTGGSSLGGLTALWLLLRHSTVFGAGLVVSPSVWWADRAVLGDVRAFDSARRRPRVWLDIGLAEGEEAVAGARDLHRALQDRGWSPGELRYLEVPDAGHSTQAWAARVEPMLLFLAPGPAGENR
jgi:predicted alpha/beta superfamily hydrolase